MNLVRFEVRFGRFEVRFWWPNLGSGGSRFGIFRFVPIPNEKFTHFLIFYEVKTFGSVRGSVFFGRFGGSKFGSLGRTSVRKVRGSVFLRFGKFEVQYFQVRSKSTRGVAGVAAATPKLENLLYK